jgi:hypothetical protein
MTLHPILVFVHVLGGVGVFVALGIEAVALARLRLADEPAEARVSMRALAAPHRLGPVAMLIALASGMWMTATSWGPEPWIVAALVGLVAMGALGGGVSLRALRRLRAALADERGRELSDAFRQVRASAALPSALRLRTAIGVGILALMTVKPPDAATASLVLAAAVLVGAVASVPSAVAAAGERDRSHADA